MTLTQLGAFVLVARLGSVKAAAAVLGVSEPAVSQALAALRKHLDDELIVRHASGMALTVGGQRLVPIASQMVSMGAEAEAAIRTAHGAPEQLRVVADSIVSMLTIDRRSPAATSLRHFLGTPPAMQLMHKPGRGLPPSRFRPPVYVTIWS